MVYTILAHRQGFDKLSFFLRKTPTYLATLIQLFSQSSNRMGLLIGLITGKATICFHNGVSFNILERIDLQVLQEVVLSDAYRLRRLTAPKLIIDVGAGIGDFSILAARLYPTAEILAFEPNPTQFSALQDNILLNNAQNITPHPYAIGTQRSYELSCDYANSQSSVIYAEGMRQCVSVPGVALAQFATRQIDLLKIDAEGAEVEALASLGTAIERVSRVHLEYHNHLIEHESEQLLSFLENNGFRCELVPDRYNSQIGLIFADRSTVATPVSIGS